MNAKLCKKLRKATRNVTEGLPERRTAKLRRQSVNDPQTVRGGVSGIEAECFRFR